VPRRTHPERELRRKRRKRKRSTIVDVPQFPVVITVCIHHERCSVVDHRHNAERADLAGSTPSVVPSSAHERTTSASQHHTPVS
jgi:hypothetical protein